MGHGLHQCTFESWEDRSWEGRADVAPGAAVRLSFPRAAAFVVTDTGTALGEAGGDLPELDLASVAANA